MSQEEVKNGQLLVAEPFMLDPYFKRAVILLCDHRPDGTLGFMLNKTLDMHINELISDFPEFKSEVFYGGPVQTDTIHFLHNLGDLLEDSVKVAEGVYWGGDFEKLKFLISSQLIQPENVRFFVGYSGWSDGQLNEELESGSWVVADSDANYIFNLQPEILWKTILENKGDIFTVIAQMPEGNNMN